MGKLIGFLFEKLFDYLGIASKVGRTFFSGIFMSVLFVLLFNVSCDLVKEFMTWAVEKANSTSFTGISGFEGGSVSGAAGWALVKLKFPECLSMIMASYPVRVLLKSIPFIRLN